jgi:hypothetical protein
VDHCRIFVKGVTNHRLSARVVRSMRVIEDRFTVVSNVNTWLSTVYSPVQARWVDIKFDPMDGHPATRPPGPRVCASGLSATDVADQASTHRLARAMIDRTMSNKPNAITKIAPILTALGDENALGRPRPNNPSCPARRIFEVRIDQTSRATPAPPTIRPAVPTNKSAVKTLHTSVETQHYRLAKHRQTLCLAC